MPRKQLLTLVLLAGLTAPAASQVVFVPVIPAMPTVKSDYGKIHTVAVVSALGERVTMTNYHFISPKTKTLETSDWGLDEQIASQLRKLLSPRFTFKDIDYDRSALAKIPNGNLNLFFSGFPKFLKTLPKDGIDAYIVVRPDLEYADPGLEGLGIENGGAFGDMTPVVWANYEIDLVEPASGEILAKGFSRIRTHVGAKPSFAGLITDARFKISDDFAVTDEQKQLLHERFSWLVSRSLIETLRDMEIGAPLPEPGARTLVPVPPDKDPFRKYKTVAVVSGVGDVLDLEHMGGTIFSRDSFSLPISDWGLDAMAEDRLKSTLQGQFEIHEAKLDRPLFANARLWDENGKLSPAFPGLAADPAIDLYVALVKVKAGAVPDLAIQGSGVGVYDKALLGAQTGIFANYALVVLDAHTLKPLLALRGRSSPARKQDMPSEPMAGAWPDKPPTLSEGQKERIHAAISDMLSDSVAETTLQSGLTRQMASLEPPDAK